MSLKTKKQGRRTDVMVKDTIWYGVKYLGYVLMVIWAISFVAVLAWVFMNSLKTGIDYTKDVFSLPKEWDWINYWEVITEIEFKGYSLLGMLGNSLIRILISVGCLMLFPQMVAYTLARVDFKGKKLIEDLIYVSMIIPIVGTLASSLSFMINTKMYDTWIGVIFASSGIGFGFQQMVLTTFYRGMESAYAEAAYIDGASEWVVFTKIYYPQSMPIMYPFIISCVIGTWNDFMDPYLFTPSKPTIALGLQQMQKTFVTFGNDYPLLYAGIILMLIPILIIFACFSNQMLNNKNLGALK